MCLYVDAPIRRHLSLDGRATHPIPNPSFPHTHTHSIGLLLTTISHTEVLLEKLAMRLGGSATGGNDPPHGLILLVEALKAALKLALLRMKRQRASALPVGAAFTADGLLLDGGRIYPSYPPVGGGHGGEGPFWGEGDRAEEEEQERRLLLQVMRAGAGGESGGGGGSPVSMDEEEEEQELRVGEKEEGQEAALRPHSPPRPQWRRGKRTGRRFLFICEEEKAIAVASSVSAEDGAASVTCSSSSSSSSCASSSSPSSATIVATGVYTDRAFSVEVETAVASARANLLLTGEVLHVLRSLLYAYLKWLVARRAAAAQQRGRRQAATAGGGVVLGGLKGGEWRWLPVLASAMVDAASLQCTQGALGTSTPLRQRHQEELQRRRSLWCLYLLRTPIFEGLTLPVAGAVDRSLGRVPLAGGVVNYAFRALCYVQRHHFMTNRD